MTDECRRDAMKLAVLGALGIAATGPDAGARASVPAVPHGISRRIENQRGGIENQRVPDLGDDTYRNPILAGDHPDPTILKDGDAYYMTFSAFDALPALVIWRSYDLLHWEPMGPALHAALGSVFAVDLCKHGGRYFIYIPIIHSAVTTAFAGMARIYVIHADSISGPWSDPVPLAVDGYIDPAHAVGEDGRRYLFLSGVARVRLTDDGLTVDGAIEQVYDGWRYPDDWIVEAYALEGPKITRRGDWFYLISAVGGTAGPPTGHMVIAARSRSIHGPWENCPHNPIVRTQSAQEPWWSRGHATLVEGPRGDWWMVYHAFENGFRTLGRQTLLEPIEWTADGWMRARGGDLSVPLVKPTGGRSGPHGIAYSDDFESAVLGARWSFYKPGIDEPKRLRIDGAALVLTGKGGSPADCSPLLGLAGDRAYEISVDMELVGPATGGLLLFYSDRLYCGMGHDGEGIRTFRSGALLSYWQEPAANARRMQLRIVNDRHVVTQYYRMDGGDWRRHGLRMETSGYHTNTADGLLSLRPALFAAGAGEVRFLRFRYLAL